jgi:multidrug efflux pump subunit AcrA (membrane-fusion protein)
MAVERHALTPEKLMAITLPRKWHSGKDIGIYALLILLVLGELHMVHRIGEVRSYVDQRDSAVQTDLQAGFRKKLAAENGVQSLALKSATNQIERRFLQMEGRARDAEINANQASQQLEQMQSAEDAALVSIQQMLAQKASVSDIRALGRQVAETRADVDLAGVQVVRLHAQIGRIEGATEDQIIDLTEQLAAIRRDSPHFLQFSLVLNHSEAVGGIAMMLTRTRQKDGQFDLRLTAGGDHIERRNAIAGEPIFFVPGNPQRAYEVVVNHIGRNEVRGFLGAPGEFLRPTSER